MINTVTDRYAPAREEFLKLFELQERTLNGEIDHPFHQMRRRAIDRLQELNFPTRKNEDWKYTSVARVLQPQYREGRMIDLKAEDLKSYGFDGLDAYRFVFINGHFSEELSSSTDELPKGIAVLNMRDAFAGPLASETAGAVLEHLATAEENPFSVLNTAFSRQGLFIHVAANVAVEKPFHLLYLAAPGEEPVMASQQLLLSAGSSSEVSVIESYYSLPGFEGEYFTNVVNRFQIAANAHVWHYKFQNEGKGGYQITNTEARQHRDSTFSSFYIDLGGRLVRNNVVSILEGEGTSTNLYGVYMAKGEQHIDTHTFIDHALPNCVSNELYKGVITDRANGVFNGKVVVRQDAQKTNAFQQNSTLVLSPFAGMDSKPQLEIFADDVRCSHGATVGQLDEDALFYLRSRGLTEDQAGSMLQHAFLNEVIDNIAVDSLRLKAEELINEKFES